MHCWSYLVFGIEPPLFQKTIIKFYEHDHLGGFKNWVGVVETATSPNSLELERGAQTLIMRTIIARRAYCVGVQKSLFVSVSVLCVCPVRGPFWTRF